VLHQFCLCLEAHSARETLVGLDVTGTDLGRAAPTIPLTLVIATPNIAPNLRFRLILSELVRGVEAERIRQTRAKRYTLNIQKNLWRDEPKTVPLQSSCFSWNRESDNGGSVKIGKRH